MFDEAVNAMRIEEVPPKQQAHDQLQTMAFERFINELQAYPADHVARSITKLELLMGVDPYMRRIKGVSLGENAIVKPFALNVEGFLQACKLGLVEDFLYAFLFELEWEWKRNKVNWRLAVEEPTIEEIVAMGAALDEHDRKHPHPDKGGMNE